MYSQTRGQVRSRLGQALLSSFPSCQQPVAQLSSSSCLTPYLALLLPTVSSLTWSAAFVKTACGSMYWMTCGQLFGDTTSGEGEEAQVDKEGCHAERRRSIWPVASGMKDQLRPFLAAVALEGSIALEICAVQDNRLQLDQANFGRGGFQTRPMTWGSPGKSSWKDLVRPPMGKLCLPWRLVGEDTLGSFSFQVGILPA
ncbi:MAG: hypothetical protein NTV33_03595, partial [Coprothermobacterota bacterium]|nr:hypothetical protein [Coprothermobacterota bacterium]